MESMLWIAIFGRHDNFIDIYKTCVLFFFLLNATQQSNKSWRILTNALNFKSIYKSSHTEISKVSHFNNWFYLYFLFYRMIGTYKIYKSQCSHFEDGNKQTNKQIIIWIHLNPMRFLKELNNCKNYNNEKKIIEKQNFLPNNLDHHSQFNCKIRLKCRAHTRSLYKLPELILTYSFSYLFFS